MCQLALLAISVLDLLSFWTKEYLKCCLVRSFAYHGFWWLDLVGTAAAAARLFFIYFLLHSLLSTTCSIHSWNRLADIAFGCLVIQTVDTLVHVPCGVFKYQLVGIVRTGGHFNHVLPKERCRFAIFFICVCGDVLPLSSGRDVISR